MNTLEKTQMEELISNTTIVKDKEEEALIEALLEPATKEEAFRELVRLYQERLYWHIRKIVLIHEDADDVLQNTFIKIFRNLASFQGNSSLFTWMYRIATNESITHINNKKRKSKITDAEYNDLAIENLESDVYFEGDVIQLKLQKAIATLPDRQRMVFNMRYFDEMPYKEISDILGVSVGGLKSTYHIASQKVREFLEDNETF